MLKTKIQSSTLLLTSILYFVVGVLCLINPKQIVTLLYYILSYGFILISIFNFLSATFVRKTKKQKQASYLESVVIFIFGFWVLINPQNLFSILPYIISAWGFINVLIRLINWYVYFSDRLIGTFRIAIEAVILTIFSILLLIRPITQAKFVIYIIGAYFIFYGFTYLQDFYNQMFQKEIKHKRKMALPIFMNALLPQRLVLYINKKLTEQPNEHSFLSINPTNEKSDIEIFIHLGDKGFDSVGHVDIAFGDIVISYGNHDSHSTILRGAVGDGVIYFAERSSYLKMIVDKFNRSIIAFGIKLTQDEKIRVKKQLLSLANRFTPWLSDQQKSDLGYSVDSTQNYASSLTRYIQPKFYKFTHGKFKTYFIMTTNCVLLADTIVGKSSIDLIAIDGMITPGTYYDFLNSEFQVEHSIVISRTIYNSYTIDELVINEDMKKIINAIDDPIAFINSFIFSDVSL